MVFGDVLTVIGGVVFIAGLAYVIIHYSILWAAAAGVSGTFVGLTLLSIGTSVPEIMAHIVGSLMILEDAGRLETLSGLVIGNNIGSDVFQQNFVVPLVGLIAVLRVRVRDLGMEVGALLGASLLVWVLSLGGWLSRWEGGLMVAVYLLYLGYLRRQTRQHPRPGTQTLQALDGWKALLMIGGALVLMWLAADRVLDSAARLVATLAISASFFGVIVLGIASALPELSTSLVAVFRGRKEMSAGILIGSNITNPLFGIGVGAMISGYAVPGVVIWYDLPVKIATGGLLYWFLRRRPILSRGECATLIGLYVVYLVVRQGLFPHDFAGR